MDTNNDFVKQAIELVAQTDRLESISVGKENVNVCIEGVKKGWIYDKRIRIEIRKSEIDPNANVFVTAKIDDTIISNDWGFMDLMKTFKNIGLFDSKLEWKLLTLIRNRYITEEQGKMILHEPPKKYQTNNRLTEGERYLDYNSNAGDYLIIAYYTHIHICFPELINKIHIEIVNNEEIIFSTPLGFENNRFRQFFRVGIALKAALKNCRTCELLKIVCMDELHNTYEAFTIDELEKMAKA
ncbi:MAG: hypothetical protein LBG15_00220 [Dysgonamonadaceae bacterium]|jgi:hypothetical protein|nr:hypothetical protein [Dysgonamonadaceae bacterium]